MTSHTSDKHFFDLFMLIVAILIGATFGLFLLANYVSGNTQEVYVLQDAPYQEQVDQNIKPVAVVALAGEDVIQSGAVAAIEPVAVIMTGPQVYNQACIACHGSGIGGAPVVGEAAIWTARIAQGNDVLTDHALNGYQGEAGYMPPKGGRIDLSDGEIIAAMDYMIETSR
jgi:cytochrome c5